MKLPEFLRPTPPAAPIRAEAEPTSKRIQDATVDQCHQDFVIGAPLRAAFDARARAAKRSEG
ncbi:hypothetical protein ACFV1F_16925 [Streptomyces sp. NPDC059590]|uniref:hypothetical protein n=1 Tax=Streptomyces sp. NPDC059590 TaxID=3346877 RepID=UPI0036CFB454